ncbi:MAG TPA: hypothetical protein VMZ31_14835 [Phycisphaerae bacterium]|nr:hypothetical protein [Phycisphaerae bacterium]
MRARAMEGTCLATLVRMALPLCRAAERQCPRASPGRPPDFPDWVMAILIMTVVLKKKKSKSAQYRFLREHRSEFTDWLGLESFPSRTTYFDRYRRSHRLFEVAIRVQGERAVAEGIADPQTMAVDKSLVAPRGPLWHKKDRAAGRIPNRLRGVDRDSTWGYSKHHGWVQGYSYETVATATEGSTVFPMLGSADTASMKEFASFEPKIDQLPEDTENVLADTGYDKNEFGDRIECDEQGRRTGRRFICPPNPRNSKDGGRAPRPRAKRIPPTPRCRREKRIAFYRSRRGQRLYARRGQTVEPFNDWFKALFELDERT